MQECIEITYILNVDDELHSRASGEHTRVDRELELERARVSGVRETRLHPAVLNLLARRPGDGGQCRIYKQREYIPV